MGRALETHSTHAGFCLVPHDVKLDIWAATDVALSKKATFVSAIVAFCAVNDCQDLVVWNKASNCGRMYGQIYINLVMTTYAYLSLRTHSSGAGASSLCWA